MLNAPVVNSNRTNYRQRLSRSEAPDTDIDIIATVSGAARAVCGARCCRFAAVHPAGWMYRLIAARPALSSSGVRRANAGSATLSAYVGS